jgi:hypothetical protein
MAESEDERIERLTGPESDHSLIINALLIRLNNRLVDMKPEWDDSITGFNEAMDIVRGALNDPIIASRANKHCPACAFGQSLDAGEGTHLLGTVEHEEKQ